jgi:hypothetical protein
LLDIMRTLIGCFAFPQEGLDFYFLGVRLPTRLTFLTKDDISEFFFLYKTQYHIKKLLGGLNIHCSSYSKQTA